MAIDQDSSGTAVFVSGLSPLLKSRPSAVDSTCLFDVCLPQATCRDSNSHGGLIHASLTETHYCSGMVKLAAPSSCKRLPPTLVPSRVLGRGEVFGSFD
jgi:hypothetical protein